MQGLRLTSQAILAGAETLSNNRLTPNQIDDLVSVFRGFLQNLADDYDLVTDLTLLEDSPTRNRCAKLAAYLLTLQENDFDNGGFAPTNANRSGFNYSLDEANFERFKYAFGLLYPIPAQFTNRNISAGQSNTPTWGYATRIIN